MPDREMPQDVAIHIHEHVGPLRERVSKLEGRMDVHDRELTLLRAGLDSLRERIDGVRIAMLDALDRHTQAALGAFDQHQKIDFDKDDDISCRLNEVQVQTGRLAEQIVSVKNWVLALGLGAGSVVAALTLLEKLGVFAK